MVWRPRVVVAVAQPDETQVGACRRVAAEAVDGVVVQHRDHRRIGVDTPRVRARAGPEDADDHCARVRERDRSG